MSTCSTGHARSHDQKMSITHPDRRIGFGTLSHELQTFRESLTNEQVEAFQAIDLHDLGVTIEAIQKKQRAGHRMQNLRRLEQFLKTIDSYCDFLATCGYTDALELVAFIWGPMKHVLEVACNVDEAFGAVLDAYQQMSRTLPAVDQLRSLSANPPVLSMVLAAYFQDIFVFHSRAMQFFKGTLWRYLFRSTWKSVSSRFSAELEQMSYRKTLVETQASISHFQQARQNHLRAAAEANRQRSNDTLQQTRAVADWLSPADVSAYQETGRKARQQSSGGGDWLLTRDSFRSWSHPTPEVTPLLWVTGIPGAGKTVLASLVIDELPAVTGAKVLYFYLRQDDPERNSLNALVRSLIHQALQHENGLLPYIYDQAAASIDVNLRSASTAEDLLEHCLRALGNPYIIIDGLDECPVEEQRNIVSLVQRFVKDSPATVDSCRCVFFSQDDQNTRPLLSRLRTLRIRTEDNSADIAAYCAVKAREIGNKFAMQEIEWSNIASQTALRADGMFLFARLVLGNLYAQTTKESVRVEMHPKNFPNGLIEAYRRILLRLDEAPAPERKEASRLLAWMTYSTRVMKWQEIQCAVSIDLDCGIVDYESRKLRLDAKQLCGALVEELPNGDVCFVHATIKDYMIKTRTVAPRERHVQLASLCLGYLNLQYFLGSDDIQSNLLQGHYAFFDYAIASWGEHLMNAMIECGGPGEQDGDLEEVMTVFFELHWTPPSIKPSVHERVLKCARNIRDRALQEKAMISLSSFHNVMTLRGLEGTAIVSIDLYKFLGHVRRVHESLAIDGKYSSTLAKYYPRKVFKCPRPNCRWFYEGFATAHERDNIHQAKHDRPFRCQVQGCFMVALGCNTREELETHAEKYHNELPSENDFPEQPSESEIPAPSFSCPQCGKFFTRASNLNAHIRAHDRSDKNFVCETCQSCFARYADLKRHKDTHDAVRKFKCHCGKSYKRLDQLTRHKVAHRNDPVSASEASSHISQPDSEGSSTRLLSDQRQRHESAAMSPTDASCSSTQDILSPRAVPRRLINTKTMHLEIFSVDHTHPPTYAILSHRWSGAEVGYDEWHREERDHQIGWAKIKGACRRALIDGHPYLWIDTCCIDKSSSAELNEAINSMFEYYRNAEVCYVHLADVRGRCTLPDDTVSFVPGSGEDMVFQDMQQSEWFTRGWTLQELLAPEKVAFFSVDWRFLGQLDKIAPIISSITRIDLAALRKKKPLETYSLAQRLSWAALRETTRQEDKAYCLLGILKVSLEVKYGIGSAAFQELQKKLLEAGTCDDSLFAWSSGHGHGLSRLFAPSPRAFEGAEDVICWRPRLMTSHFFYRSDGIAPRVCLHQLENGDQGRQRKVALLNCTRALESDKVLGLCLESESAFSDAHDTSDYRVCTVDNYNGSQAGSRLIDIN